MGPITVQLMKLSKISYSVITKYRRPLVDGKVSDCENSAIKHPQYDGNKDGFRFAINNKTVPLVVL